MGFAWFGEAALGAEPGKLDPDLLISAPRPPRGFSRFARGRWADAVDMATNTGAGGSITAWGANL